MISRYSIKYIGFKVNLFSGLLTLFQCPFSYFEQVIASWGVNKIRSASQKDKKKHMEIVVKVVKIVNLFSFFLQ